MNNEINIKSIAPAGGCGCPPLVRDPEEENPRRVSPDWTFADYRGSFKCRISGLRMRYTVRPGLYALGSPGGESEVFVSANYKLSFDVLRRSLRGMDAWILVLDTKGINVWCAAGKGTFGTDELVKRIRLHRIEKLVAHRRIIVPQLGAPGISSGMVRKMTGFGVHFGPVRAKDIPAYVGAGLKATPEMRKVDFPFIDRIKLVPMEIIPAVKGTLKYFLLGLVFFGLGREGILFSAVIKEGFPVAVLAALSLLSGSLLVPAFLPWIPFRSFALKGWLGGFAVVVLAVHFLGALDGLHPLLYVFSYVFFPVFSSYLALQFTGATTFTGMSGVKKELKLALPLYRGAMALSAAALAAYKLISLELL